MVRTLENNDRKVHQEKDVIYGAAGYAGCR